MRVLRMFFIDRREAVRLATAPFSNSMRTLVISGVGLTMLTPLALIWLTGDFTMVSRMSKSCTIRSRTTGTSVPRGLNKAKRCASMKSGSPMNGSAATKAGLNRSTWPTCTFTPASSASFFKALASSGVATMGFSMKTCLRFRKAFEAHSKWRMVGVTMSTTSTASISASTESKRFTFSSSSTCCAVSSAGSKNPTKSYLSICLMQFKWIFPKWPAPKTPIFSILQYNTISK